MDYSGKIITKNPVEPSQTSAPGVWTLDQATQAVQGNNWPIAYVPNPISRSLRFNSADSAYLNRTFTTPTLSTKWTWNGWVKRSGLGASQTLFSASSDVNNWGYFGFLSGDTLTFSQADGGSVTSTVTTTQVFRDVGAWYCITIVFDTTQGTASNRLKMYVNGVQITAFGTASYLGSGVASRLNAATAHQLGRYFSAANYFSGYLTEVNFIDGQALDASYFGMTDPRTGAWIPKKYSGTYGTNGFYLNFSDNSTTAALGTDYSGNNNTWTTNNFSVTAGSGNDSLTDVPTPWIPYNTTGDVGGVVRGNYCTFNPLNANSAITLSNGNLTITQSNNRFCGTTIPVASGKWYFEYLPANTGTGNSGIGVIRASDNVFGSDAFSAAGSYAGVGYLSSGNKNVSGTITSYGATYVSGDVIGVAIDLDSGTQTITFYKNNTSQGSINIPTASQTWMVVCDGATSVSANINFGQRPFAYTPPAGFKSLCTTNLPEPTILDGGDYFNAVLYTGNGSTQSIAGVGFQPDLVWAKCRSNSYHHKLVDAVRGATLTLSSSQTAAEQTETNSLTAFNSDGFSLGSISSMNASAETFVAWNWKAGGTGVSNTAGTITSTVSANTTAGFSIVTYTGDSSANQTVGHGLGATPEFIIVKVRGTTGDWVTYNKPLGADRFLILNATNAQSGSVADYWGTPSSTTFGIKGGGWSNNFNGYSHVAYCFAPVAGYSAFGSYTGNLSSNGPFVYTGFRPRYVLLKRYDTGSTGSWYVWDTARDTYNWAYKWLAPNSTSAENTSSGSNVWDIDILSNGFKIRNDGAFDNASGGTYIYAAFAENPFKYSTAR